MTRPTHLFPAFRVEQGEWHNDCLLCGLEIVPGELAFLLSTWDEGTNRFEAPDMQVERDDASADNFRYIFSGVVHVSCASDYDYVIPFNVADFFPPTTPIVLPTLADNTDNTDYLNALYGDRGTSRFHRIALDL